MLLQLLNLAMCNFFFIHSKYLHCVNLPCTTNIPLIKYFKKKEKEKMIVQSVPCESVTVTRQPKG